MAENAIFNALLNMKYLPITSMKAVSSSEMLATGEPRFGTVSTEPVEIAGTASMISFGFPTILTGTSGAGQRRIIQSLREVIKASGSVPPALPGDGVSSCSEGESAWSFEDVVEHQLLERGRFDLAFRQQVGA
jgi:hypothetical protein